VSLPERRFSAYQRLGYLHARAALVSCRPDEVLDEIVGDPSPVGGAQPIGRDSQLVDHAHEWAGSNRGPEGDHAHAHDSSIDIGDDDRRRGDEEQVAQELRVVSPGFMILVGAARQQADGSVQIGELGGADVNLHEGRLERLGVARSDDAAGQPDEVYHDQA
jgi:hypothetical protein